MKTSVYHYFAETVRHVASKTAVIETDRSWTFGQLAAATHRMAAFLLTHELPVNAVVAVLLRKSCLAVVSDLAITAIGCAYMNLDVRSPADRIGQVLDVVKPSLILTDSAGLAQLSQISGLSVPALDIAVLDVLASESGDLVIESILTNDRLAQLIDTDPYCVINTSGSTGVPKGVVLNHRSFVDFVGWSEYEFGINGNEIVGSLSPMIFDIFSFELCMLAFKGSTLCLIDERLSPYPAKIIEIIELNRVSYLFWVPTIMVNIANMGLLSKYALRDLRMVWFAGEVFPTIHFNKWFDRFPEVRFVNLYGPIEITLDCTFYEVKERIPDDQPIPMGYACRNTAILVLNPDGTATPDGETGELYVRGTSLAMGYYNNPDQTARAFVQNPLNRSYPEVIYKTGDLVVRKGGIFYFKGRADNMIKHLGYRIELADVEHAILSCTQAIRNVCVVYCTSRKEIVAFCELSEPMTLQEFRGFLASKVPAYMIPSRVVEVDRMPMNANGKIDRLYLKGLIGE